MADYFDLNLAYNPDTEQLVAGGTFEVFAPEDLSFTTPLPVFEASSGVGLSALVSSNTGVLPQFRVAGDPTEVVVRSGSFQTRLTSKYGTKGDPGKSAFEYAQESGFEGSVEDFSRYLALVGRTISDAEIVNGELVITTADGEVLNLGQVRGMPGLDGVGIGSVNVADGNLIVTLTDGRVIPAGSVAGPAGPPVSTAGSTAGQVYTSTGPSGDPEWQDPTGGSPIEGAPSTWPTTFPPAAHTHDVGNLRNSGSELLAAILTFLRSGSIADARAAIGAGTGNGNSNLQLGSTGSTAAPGNHVHTASAVTFAAEGPITATTVQEAILQAAALGGGGGSSLIVGGLAVMIWDGDAWPEKPEEADLGWWISTWDPAAPMPEMGVGDVWDRHPDALEVL